MESFKIQSNRLVKKNAYIIFIFLIGLFFLIPLFTTNFYITHDGQAQVIRIAAYYQAIMDGQIPPRWAGNLNYGYGLPTLNFFFPLEGYLGTLLHLIGFNFQDSFKILMAASFLLAPIFFFYWLTEKFPKTLAFAGAVFYGLAPYHFLNIYVRGQLAEMLAFVFIPLLFLAIEKNLKKPSLRFVILGGIASALLILSHSILSLVFTGMAFSYITLRTFPKIKLFFKNFAVLFLGLLFSAYFWIPALYEGKYINSKIFVADLFKDNFANLSNLFYSPWGFGSNINLSNGLSPQIGPFLVTLSILSVILLFKKEKKREYIFWLVIFVFFVFLSTSFSSFIWGKVHLLQQFQFPWRLTAISSFAAVILSIYFLSYLQKRKVLIILLFLFILFSLQYAFINKTIGENDEFYLKYPGTAAYHNEATTIWTAGDADSFPKSPVEIIQGSGDIKLIEKKIGFHKFKTISDNNIKVVDNTVYFPGWEVKINEEKVPIEYQDQNYRGLITFDAKKGDNLIEVKFKETKVRLVADLISLASVVIILLYLIKRLIFK